MRKIRSLRFTLKNIISFCRIKKRKKLDINEFMISKMRGRDERENINWDECERMQIIFSSLIIIS
jgi:hypothetical protein